MPQFSVIIPTRNRLEFLSEAIGSVYLQRSADFELLVINDGDTELGTYPDPRVRVLSNQMRGAVPARNLGVQHANGDFIAFLDDDDKWIDDYHLAKSGECISNGADFTFGDGIMQYPGEKFPRRFEREATASSLQVDNTILISTVCYRRTLHDTLAMFDESLPYYWDWDWYLRIARGGFSFAHIASPVVDIRIHAHNMSGLQQADARLKNLELFAAKHAIGPLILKNHGDFSTHV
jgi:glycosyltransferase involved in cell wall biosynthesis